MQVVVDGLGRQSTQPPPGLERDRLGIVVLPTLADRPQHGQTGGRHLHPGFPEPPRKILSIKVHEAF